MSGKDGFVAIATSCSCQDFGRSCDGGGGGGGSVDDVIACFRYKKKKKKVRSAFVSARCGSDPGRLSWRIALQWNGCVAVAGVNAGVVEALSNQDDS